LIFLPGPNKPAYVAKFSLLVNFVVSLEKNTDLETLKCGSRNRKMIQIRTDPDPQQCDEIIYHTGWRWGRLACTPMLACASILTVLAQEWAKVERKGVGR
jgi:hypothetical protein